MSDLPSHRELLRDARVAPHATSATPVWLWSTDGGRILWANPVGAAIFGSADAVALAARPFAPREASAAQIVRLAGTLPHGGAARLERLRGFGTGFAPLLCTCSRIVLAGHVAAILVVALEPAGPALPLAERVRRLFETSDAGEGNNAIAVFSSRGDLVYATPAARERLGSAASLRSLNAEDLGAQAESQDRVAGDTAMGSVTIERLGRGDDRVLAMTLPARPLETAPLSPAATAAPEPVVAPEAVAAPEPASTLIPTSDAPPPEPESPPPTDSAAEDAVETPEVIAPFTDVASEPAVDESAPAADEAPEAAAAAAEPEREPVPVAPLKIDVPLAERRHPLRFVWQMDADGRFSLGSEEFTEVIGPHIAVTLGRPWKDIAEELALDPENQVARAVATRDTWSGITVSWPVDDSADRLKVEMSGLPIYDRNRAFLGYRGFGVCRDVERINVLAQMRRSAPMFAAASGRSALDRDMRAPAPAAVAPPPASAEDRPPLTLVPAAKNVVPFRSATAESRAPALSPVEHNAFRELARQLTARLKDTGETAETGEEVAETRVETAEVDAASANIADTAPASAHDDLAATPPPPADADVATERSLLDRLPVGILVYRFERLLYANRIFLDWTGHADLAALEEAGGLDTLFIASQDEETTTAGGAGRTVAIASGAGERQPVEGRLFSVPWNGEPALVLVLIEAANEAAAADHADGKDEATGLAEAEARELTSVVEAATDGVVVVDRDATILSANRGAQALLGATLVGGALIDLFAPESQRVVRHQFDTLARGTTDITVTDGREVAARVRQNGHVPLLVTIGRISGRDDRFCIVMRDITAWKSHEHELVAAKLAAERASKSKADFIATVSHGIRTPLNSIIGFSEVMIEERFGPIGNERYREYLKDIRQSGEHVVAFINDLLDLAKIEAGKLDLTFVGVNLNDMIQAGVALMQPQANRDHILIRSSLAANLKPVVADAKAVRQIVLNLLANSIKFTAAGGQVIVSTALSDEGGVVMRVRDTGIGMSESELAAALEPFRQAATASRWDSSGTGLGLPLTKALTEANRARFAISSKVNEGTLVEITFAPTRVLTD